MTNLRWRLGIVGAALVLTGVPVAPSTGQAASGLTGSPHDFSETGPAANDLGVAGPCAACHRPHGAGRLGMWSRSLEEETRFFAQDERPNYVAGSTLLCYDCHDDNADRSLTLIDDDPPRRIWRSGHEPQNVAFTDLVPSGYERETTRTGYYELIDGVVPSSGNSGPVDGSPTGGHYWKVTRSGTPEYRRGDKIDCSFCHDPHRRRTGSNEVFLLTETGGGDLQIGDSLRASSPPLTRNGSGDGRRMCAACHGYSQSGSPQSFRSVELPRPPATVTEHRESDRTPCTRCHEHNRIAPEAGVGTACDSCHGYPPTTVGDGWSGPGDTDESYPGGAGAHLAHRKGAGKPATAPDLHDFGCLGGACHPEDSHRQGGRAVSRANVQVVFSAAWNPNGVFAPGSSPLADACTQLYCHSNGLVENGANPGDDGTGEAGASGLGEWAESSGRETFYGKTPAGPVATWGGRLDCKGCHGKGDPDYRVEEGTRTAQVPVSAPDYLNAGAHEDLGDNRAGVHNDAGANTHYIHVYKLPNHTGGGCSCHGSAADAAPPKHVNRQADVSACASRCHNGATWAWGAKLGSDVGDSCAFWCHGKMHTYDSAGGRVTKSPASSLPLDADPKYMRSGHGLQPPATYPSGNAGAGLACSDCHLATDRFATNGPLEASYHYERHPPSTGNPNADLAENPYWLKGAYADDPDALCMSCHDGSAARESHGHTAQGMAEFGDYAPKYASPGGAWDTFTPPCVSCHDPHGEANWYMLYDGDAEKSASGQTPTYSGPVIYKGSRFGVTVAETDAYGRPPGPDYARSQRPVQMTGDSSIFNFATGDGDGVCEVCHTRTQYFRRDGSSPGGAHEPKVCTRCHPHEASFAPMSCEGCHGKNGRVSAGANGTRGDEDDAPNVVSAQVGFGWLSVWDGTWWDETQGGDDATQQGGHGDPDGRERGDPAKTPTCKICHDVDAPPDTHFDGVYNSLGSELPMDSNRSTPRPKGNQNANTAHLRPEFFTKYPANGSGPWGNQVAVDNYCYRECHEKQTLPRMANMRHEKDTTPTAPDYRSVELGTHLTKRSTRLAIMDSDLNTGDLGTPEYSPCVACHNPHGSTCEDTGAGTKNLMLVDTWKKHPMALCDRCHE